MGYRETYEQWLKEFADDEALVKELTAIAGDEKEVEDDIDDIHHKFRMKDGQNRKMADYLIDNKKLSINQRSMTFSDYVSDQCQEIFICIIFGNLIPSIIIGW